MVELFESPYKKSCGNILKQHFSLVWFQILLSLFFRNLKHMSGVNVVTLPRSMFLETH